MNKFTRGLLSIIACLFTLAAFLIVLFALMDAISYFSIFHIWRAVFALPFLAAAWKLFVLLDRACDELSSGNKL